MNPDHLEAVTQIENNRRAAARKSRCPQGHPYSGTDNRGHRICTVCHREALRRWRQAA